MNPNTTVRCSICNKEIHNLQLCGSSKIKGWKTLYFHTDCIKYRKERKE